MSVKILLPDKTIDLTIEKQSKNKVTASNSEYMYEGESKSNYADGKGTLFSKLASDKFVYQDGEFKKGFLIKGCIYNVKHNIKEYEGTFKNGKLYGKGKHYFNDENSFYEGIFKDGELNGKGKDVYHGVVIEEGVYKDGLLNGKGKEYHKNSKVEYEGSFKNGDRDGKGKQYNDEGVLLFEGTWKKGAYDGKGKKYTKIRYGSDWVQSYIIVPFKYGREEGKGVQYNQNGKVIGKYNFKNGRKSGKGISYFDDGKIKSIENWENGRLKGKYKEYFRDGKIRADVVFDKDGKIGKLYDKEGYYEVGRYKFGRREGPFKLYYPNGTLEEKGTFESNFRNGPFSMYHDNGKLSFKGHFNNNKKEGKGISYRRNGKKIYEGNFSSNFYSGAGKLYDENGKLEKQGIFYVGHMKEGIHYMKDGSYIKGKFLNGKPNSLCSFYGANKKLKMKGYFSEGIKDGEVRIYRDNGKLEFKGNFVDNKKDGSGVEYNENGKVLRKGYWKDDKYIGVKDPKKIKFDLLVEENNIKKFLQTNDKTFLKKVKTESMKEYLKKYARKEVKGTKPKVVKQLQLWRKQIKQQKPKEKKQDGPMVFDAYEGGDVPIKEFLEEENRVLLLDEKGHYYGAYLEQCEILYECQNGRARSDYIGRHDVHSMIQFNTASGPKFYFDTDIDKDLKKGYNLFHFKTEPKNITILSKNVAAGGLIVSALHCDPKDVIKLSKVTKKEKIGKGLTKTIGFEF